MSEQQPHLVSLVLQSKKALQHGEQLCSKAHTQSSASAQASVDILAIDAKVRWFSGAIVEQLMMASTVAKCIEDRRAQLRKQVQSWDVLRSKHQDLLDGILDALGSQFVPSEFHEDSSDTSLFGSQNSDEDGNDLDRKSNHRVHSPLVDGHSATNGGKSLPFPNKKRLRERSRWKTLRDFVDDRAIEEAMESIDSERAALDELLGQTDEYPETLKNTIESIRNSIPTLASEHANPASIIECCVAAQDGMKASMAVRLEDLARHYDQMANALRESETSSGPGAFSEEDIKEMNRDTEELPAIVGELEEGMAVIDSNHNQLQIILTSLRKGSDDLNTILDDLDEFGDIMTEVLQTQESVEAKFQEDINGLHQHLVLLEQLHDRYVLYQTAYNKLVLEMARRGQYRDAVDHIVRGMTKQLEEMTMEESQVRNHFNSEYGGHLPEDICLYVGNMPTRWHVVPLGDDLPELLPEIPDDLVAEAKEKLGLAENYRAETPGDA